MIPKIIHYCWFGPNSLPPLVEQCIISWEKYCPDYIIKRWDDSNSPIDHPVVRRALSDELWAYAADYVRLHALYEEGGVYLDTDIELIKSLDPLIVGDGFSAFERPEFVANGVLAACSKNNVIHAAMKNMENFVNQHLPFPTGPRILTAALIELNDGPIKYNDVVGGIKLLEPKSFYPYNPYDLTQSVKLLMYKDITENTFGIHHWEKSWGKSGKKALVLKWRNRLRKYGLIR